MWHIFISSVRVFLYIPWNDDDDDVDNGDDDEFQISLVKNKLHLFHQLFPGNSDRNTVVKNTMRKPLARYVRIFPTKSKLWDTMRVGLFGYPESKKLSFIIYTYFKKRCRGERRLHDRNELWVPFGMQNFTSCVAHAYACVASENQALQLVPFSSLQRIFCLINLFTAYFVFRVFVNAFARNNGHGHD